MDSINDQAPAVTNVSLTNVVINGRKVADRSNMFMGLDEHQIKENLAALKRVKFLISDDETVKPYANLAIRLLYPPTRALKEVVDYSYPMRVLTKDKQFVKNMAGKLYKIIIILIIPNSYRLNIFSSNF